MKTKLYLRLLAFLLLLTTFNALGGDKSAFAQEINYYVKVTSVPTDWSGDYLIVYEAANLAFDGSLSTLDATGNSIYVTISDNKIEANDKMNSAKFTIDSNGYIKSASGNYIGQTSNTNGLKSSKTDTYENTLSLNNDGTANVVSSGAYLRYNAASNQNRFRYYKSSSYSAQKAICLYKYVEGSSIPEVQINKPAFDPISGTEFADHLEVSIIADEGMKIFYKIGDGEYQQYFDSFTIAESSEITAYAQDDEGNKSAESTVKYIKRETYALVTDVNSLYVGDEIVIVASEYNYALSTNQKSNNRGQAEVVKNGNMVTFGKDVQILTLSIGKKDGTFAFNTGSGYLYAASSTANHLKTESYLSDNSSWSIQIAEDGVATIKAQGENSRNWLRYNESSSLFSCYSSGQQSVSIYKKPQVFNISSVGYATFYTDQVYKMPEGLEGAVISAVDGVNLAANYCYQSGDVVPANTALLIRGAEGKYICDFATTEDIAPEGNMLHGLLEDGVTTSEVANAKYYKLANDSEDGLGFYWGADNGGAFNIQANKAYLVVPGTSAVRGFSLKDMETTGVVQVKSGNAEQRIYDINGRVMNVKQMNALQKGIYVVNGKKYIVK